MPTTKTPSRAEPRKKPATARGPTLPMPSVLLDATQTPDVVTTPERTVLDIENRGAPESAIFQESIGALYGIAYTLKFARKKTRGKDFGIGPLEGRWWTDGAGGFLTTPREEWRWHLRIAMPDTVTTGELAAVIETATTRKGGKLFGSAEAKRVTLEHLPAARYGRVLHVGPYAEETQSFLKIRQMLIQTGLKAGNAHLEVYVSDLRRSKPENLKTVLLLELA